VSSCRNAAAVLGGAWATLGGDEIPASMLDSELLVLSSWDAAYEPLLARRVRPTVPRWHSPLLQTELGQEGWKVRRIVELLDAGTVPALAANDEATARALGRDRVVHLPDVLDQREYAVVRPAQLDGVNISLFGDAHWRKNLFVQSAAFELVRRGLPRSDCTLHLNGQTLRAAEYREWLHALRIPYVEHGWLGRTEYLSLVAAMDAGLSATLSEAYCYVAADHLALGVPVVTSPAVTCVDAGDLTVADPSDIVEVAGRLRVALADPGLAVPARARLRERAEENAERAESALLELVERAGQTV
jgi:hypothetical protein